jgi:hypothetical protein
MTDEKQPKSEKDLKKQVLGTVGITTLLLDQQPRKLGELLEEIAPEGEKVKVADIVGWTIVIRSIRLFEGQYGVGAYVIFTDENGAIYNTVIGQKILLTKLCSVAEELPVECTIIKNEGGQFGRYYDFE